MARPARVLQLFLGKGEFALLPVGPPARVAASCTASDSNQNSYAQRSLQKRSLLRRLGCDYLGPGVCDSADAPYEAPVSPQP
jgi:hypothetical protein